MGEWLEELNRLLLEGRTNAEISEILGVNEHAMWKRVERAGLRIETDSLVRRLVTRELTEASR